MSAGSEVALRRARMLGWLALTVALAPVLLSWLLIPEGPQFPAWPLSSFIASACVCVAVAVMAFRRDRSLSTTSWRRDLHQALFASFGAAYCVIAAVAFRASEGTHRLALFGVAFSFVLYGAFSTAASRLLGQRRWMVVLIHVIGLFTPLLAISAWLLLTDWEFVPA